MTRPDGISRRHWGKAGLWLAASLVVPALQAQPRSRPERSRTVMAVSGKSSLGYLPLTISEQLGYFKAEGLELEVNDFGTAVRASQAVLSGAADVCSGSFSRTIELQLKSQWFQSFVMQTRTPQIAFGVSVRNMPQYKNVTDLKGKKIGVATFDSVSYLTAGLVLARFDLKPSDVIFVEVGSASSALAALRSGQVDAISHTDPVMTMLEQKGDVKIIAETRTLKGTIEVFGGPMPSTCLYSTGDFIQRHPNMCQALTNAIVHGLKWLQTAGPGDILKTVPEAYLLGDRALYLASFDQVRESISLDGLMPENGPRTALRALASFNPDIKAEQIDLVKTVNNAFARRAKERFKA
ncbi:MAG: ABC transporter substrate-binding protein [Polaromonas sp.]|nr:ABC transporter substrate-binding protein [Polaromonas sp.]